MAQSNYILKFTPIAVEDMDQIYSYIFNDLSSEKSANDLVEKIENSITRLKKFPFSGSYVLDELLKTKGYRKLIVDNYIVFYLVNDSEKQVVIMRILYGARDFESIL